MSYIAGAPSVLDASCTKASPSSTKKSRRLSKDHEDDDLFASLPGAGPVLAPRLLASMGSERERFASARDPQRFSGIAPVTKQSGASRYVNGRYRCPVFCKQTFHEYAKESRPSHRRPPLAFKWQRIIRKRWSTRRPYKKETYEASLRENASPIIALFDQI